MEPPCVTRHTDHPVPLPPRSHRATALYGPIDRLVEEHLGSGIRVKVTVGLEPAPNGQHGVREQNHPLPVS
jgi:hypothetical protein